MVVFKSFLATISLAALGASWALDNGMYLTPPMGWLAWERFRCNTDCDNYPKECISELLFQEMAEVMVKDGWIDAGYNWVSVDDCWAEKTRDPKTKQLVADRQRFPSGMKALGDFLHKRNINFGIYGDIGTATCAGYPGALGYFDIDAKTYADWGVDSLKVDGCYMDTSRYADLYPRMGQALNASGRHIAYICSWPAYIIGSANFSLIAEHCNSWRNYNDIQDTWDSVSDIINWWAKNQDSLVEAAHPGAWNDPDMLVIGNYGLSESQSRVQMAIWSIVAAPLMLSHDLRQTPAWAKDILQNKEVIAVNQDPLGIQGKKIAVLDYNTQLWVRKLKDNRVAVVLTRFDNFPGAIRVDYRVWLNAFDDIPLLVTFTLHQVGWTMDKAKVRDLFAKKDIQTAVNKVTVRVAPFDAVFLLLSPVTQESPVPSMTPLNWVYSPLQELEDARSQAVV